MIALIIFEIVAPVFILAGIGVGWVRLGFDYHVRFVSQLAMKLSLPALIFMALVTTELSAAQIAKLAGAALLAHLVLIGGFWALTRVMGLERRVYLAPLIFGNTGNLGLPLALFAFGQAGLEIAVVVFAVSLVLSFTFGIWVVSGGGSPVSTLKEPAAIAIFLAFLVMWLDLSLPTWLTNTVDLIGQMAIPLMLLTLGVAVGRLRPASFTKPFVLVTAKFFICLAVAWITGRAFGLQEMEFAVLVLQMVTPVAVTAYLIAETHNVEAQEVAALVVVSTVLSVIYLPALLSVLL